MVSTSNIISLAALIFVLVGAGAIWRVHGSRIKAAYAARVRGRGYVPLPLNRDQSVNVESRFIS